MRFQVRAISNAAVTQLLASFASSEYMRSVSQNPVGTPHSARKSFSGFPAGNALSSAFVRRRRSPKATAPRREGGSFRFGMRAPQGLCPYMSILGRLPSGSRMWRIHG